MSDQQVTAPLAEVMVPPQLLEAMARALVAALGPPSQPVASGAEEAANFLTAGQFARCLGISRETVRRLAIAKVPPNTMVCRGARKATRRFPRRFADESADSGLDVAELAEFAARWRARVFWGRGMTGSRRRRTNSGERPCLPWCVTDLGDPASADRTKAICRSYPAHPACLEWALAGNERTGIWGGATPNERRALRRAAAEVLTSGKNDGTDPGIRRNHPMRHGKQAVLRFSLADLVWAGAR